jgi:hypothetical protein
MGAMRRIAASVLAAATIGGMGLATAGPAAAVTGHLNENYWCDPGTNDNVYLRWHCPGTWYVGRTYRDFETSADVWYAPGNNYRKNRFFWVHSVYSQRKEVYLYCRNGDGTVGILKRHVSIGGGLSDWYDFYDSAAPSGYTECNGYGVGFYVKVLDTYTGLYSYLNFNDSVSGYGRRAGSEYYAQ